MELSAYPAVYASDVATTAAFYEQFGFTRYAQSPPTGAPGFVGLRRHTSEIVVIDAATARGHYGDEVGTGLRFEMYVFVEDTDVTLKELRDNGVTVLREPVDMPWGERIGFVADPDGNPVALASATR